MKKIIILVALALTGLTMNAQQQYKEIEGTYYNPSIEGDIVVKDYKLSFEGRIYTFRTEESFIWDGEILTGTIIFDDDTKEVKFINRYINKSKVLEFRYDKTVSKKEYLLIEKN